MTPEEVYNKWRSTLSKPDDSLFYYHPGLERILLGLTIYVLSSKPLIEKLGKAKALSLLHIYVPDLITACFLFPCRSHRRRHDPGTCRGTPR